MSRLIHILCRSTTSETLCQPPAFPPHTQNTFRNTPAPPSAHLTQVHTRTLASTHASTQRTRTPTQTHTHLHLILHTPTWFPLWFLVWDIRTLLGSTPALRTTGHPFPTTPLYEGAGITASPIGLWWMHSGTGAKMEEDINMNGNGCKDGGGHQHERERVQRWRRTST